ncbi:hypothetical protein PFISCL1PPCAC_1124, partial [Pristionchus fissidentatus]
KLIKTPIITPTGRVDFVRVPYYHSLIDWNHQQTSIISLTHYSSVVNFDIWKLLLVHAFDASDVIDTDSGHVMTVKFPTRSAASSAAILLSMCFFYGTQVEITR